MTNGEDVRMVPRAQVIHTYRAGYEFLRQLYVMTVSSDAQYFAAEQASQLVKRVVSFSVILERDGAR